MNNTVTKEQILKMDAHGLMGYIKSSINTLKSGLLDHENYLYLKELAYKALEHLYYKSELLAMPYLISLKEC